MTDGNAVLTSPTLLHDLGDPDQREAAWRAFLRRYQPLIYHWSRRTGLGHDDAEDISAAVLCKLVTALREFVYDPAHRFRGWLKTLVENEVRGLYRQRDGRQGQSRAVRRRQALQLFGAQRAGFDVPVDLARLLLAELAVQEPWQPGAVGTQSHGSPPSRAAGRSRSASARSIWPTRRFAT